MTNYAKYDNTSWEVLNDKVVIKSTDLSALKYNEIRIANEVKDFFCLRDMEKHERREINLFYGGVPYQCIIYLDSYYLGRGKLRWGRKFKSLFSDLISGYFFNADNPINLPLLRFSKRDSLNYDISFIFVKEIIEESIELDDSTPDPRMKKSIYESNFMWKIQAFKYHGCKCNICGFDYVDFYGVSGKGKCSVYLTGKIEANSVPEPQKDLIPVCDNCLKLLKSGLEPDELKDLIKVSREISTKTLKKY